MFSFVKFRHSSCLLGKMLNVHSVFIKIVQLVSYILNLHKVTKNSENAA